MDARAALALLMDDGPAPSVKPAPPPQHCEHLDVVRRSVEGVDHDPEPRRPSLAGFVAAMAASSDWGVPVRSSSDPDRFGKGAIGGSGGSAPHDPHVGRCHYALADRELRRIADSLPVKMTRAGVVLDGAAQLSIWSTVAGPGKLTHRVIRGGEPKRQKPGRLAAPKERVVTVPERRSQTATDASDRLAEHGIDLTPHEVGLICRTVTRVVSEAFASKGWVRPRRLPERAEPARVTGSEDAMAAPAGFDLEGWKEIADVIGLQPDAARERARAAENPLPVATYMGRIVARRVDLVAWVGRQARPGVSRRT